MEIEIGEYVRTRDGLIGKYYINKNSFNVIKIKNKEIGFDIDKDIVRHSKDVLYIIKIGDIIELKENIDDFKKSEKLEISDFTMLNYVIQAIRENKIKLISILTREQYEENYYNMEE